MNIKELTLNSVIKSNDIVNLYCEATGADTFDTLMAIANVPRYKKEYTIKEVIELTKGFEHHEYFESLFKK